MTDAELFALLDGDAPSAGFEAAHLRTCAECADRLRVMRLRWSRLDALLSDADAPLGGLLPSTLAELRAAGPAAPHGACNGPPRSRW